jgi:hypothetical protein
MNHIKLFESFDSNYSPEGFETEIDNALRSGGDHIEISNLLKSIFYKYQKLVYSDKNYSMHVKKVTDWIDSLPSDQKMEVKHGKKVSDYSPDEDEDKEVWADFLYSYSENAWPNEDRLESFGLRFDALPDGTPRYDEKGFSVVGTLSNINKFSRFIDTKPTYWGLVYPGTDYAKKGRKYEA